MSRWDWSFSPRKRMMENLDQDIRDYVDREAQDNIEGGLFAHPFREYRAD